MKNSILPNIQEAKKNSKKLLAILLDPEKVLSDAIPEMAATIARAANYIFVGGSTVANGKTEALVSVLKKYSSLPIVLFPGDYTQITDKANAILFLSLLSGDNPEYLIRQQLKSIPQLKNSGLEIIPTGYILIDGATETSVQRISNTKPILSDDTELAVNTAVAGMYMGKELIYLEAGSGAKNPVPESTIAAVSKSIDIPLIVGGGIRSRQQLESAYKAGADLVVIGTAFEENHHIFDTF